MVNLVIELKDGIGYYRVRHIINSNHGGCKIDDENIVITGKKTERKEVIAVFVCRENWKPHHDTGKYNTTLPNGVMYRKTKKVTEKTQLGRLFGDNIYSPDTSTELLCISKFILRITTKDVALDIDGVKVPIQKIKG